MNSIQAFNTIANQNEILDKNGFVYFFADYTFCIVVYHNAEDEKDPWLGLSFAATGRLAKHLRRRGSKGGLNCYITLYITYMIFII